MAERDLEEQVKDMSDGELEVARRDMVTGLGFMTPANGMYWPAQAFLGAVSAELAQRRAPARRHDAGQAGVLRPVPEHRAPPARGRPGT